MDAGVRAVQVVIDLVGDERAEGREQPGYRQQAAAQGREGRRVAVPEAPARAAHVPVGEVLHEVGDRAPGDGRVVGVQPLGYHLRRGGRARQRPAVKRFVGRLRLGGVQLLAAGVGVEHVEVVGAPQLLEEQAHACADRLG